MNKYIDGSDFTFCVEELPKLDCFTSLLGEMPVHVSNCVLNTEQNFPLSYTKQGTLAKRQREYFDGDWLNFEGKMCDYKPVLKDHWDNSRFEYCYFFVWNGSIVKIGQTTDTMKARFASYSCGTRRARSKGTCSVTNYFVSECNTLAILKDWSVQVWVYPIEKQFHRVSRWGGSTELPLSVSKGYETLLIDRYVKEYNSLPPLCTQSGKW